MFSGFSKKPQILTPLTMAVAVTEKKAPQIVGSIEYPPQVTTKLLTSSPIFASGMDDAEYQQTVQGVGLQTAKRVKYVRDEMARFEKCVELFQMGVLTLYGRKMSDVMGSIASHFPDPLNPLLATIAKVAFTVVGSVYGGPYGGVIGSTIGSAFAGGVTEGYNNIIKMVKTVENEYRNFTEPEVKKIQILAKQISMK